METVWPAMPSAGCGRFRLGFRAGASAVGQGAIQEGEQAIPVALQPGGAKSVGVGHGEAVDGAGVDLGGVVDT